MLASTMMDQCVMQTFTAMIHSCVHGDSYAVSGLLNLTPFKCTCTGPTGRIHTASAPGGKAGFASGIPISRKSFL